LIATINDLADIMSFQCNGNSTIVSMNVFENDEKRNLKNRMKCVFETNVCINPALTYFPLICVQNI